MILHNLIVRMQQKGDFSDEADGVTLITEFPESDDQTILEADVENEDNRRRIKREIIMYLEDNVVKWIRNDVNFTDFNALA